MLRCSKLIVLSAISLGCVGMILPTHVDARGGGGGGGGRGGGGFGGGGFGGGGFRGGGYGGGGFGGGEFRGGSYGGGSYGGDFRGAQPGGYTGGWGSGYRGGVGNFESGGGNFASSHPAPTSPGWGGGRGEGRGGFGRGGRGGYGGWGWWLGDGYWGFDDPWWYGGFPFWYDSLAYGNYWNPYYDSNPNDYGDYNYGVPLQQVTTTENQSEDPYFSAARESFYAGNYQEALTNIQRATTDMPSDQDVHEFHALVLFALGDYQRAAAVAHDVLNAGPGWDWSILQSFYPSPDVYTRQLRALEKYTGEHYDQAAPRFLLADQYLMLGHFKSAERQLEAVVSVESRDRLSKNILAGLKNAPSIRAPSTGASGQSSASNSSTVPVTPQALAGTWTSHPAPGITISATFQPDGNFVWKFAQGSNNQTFSGTYVDQGDELVLTRQDGQKMDGTVTMGDKNDFHFVLKNGNPNDPGLEFTK